MSNDCSIILLEVLNILLNNSKLTKLSVYDLPFSNYVGDSNFKTIKTMLDYLKNKKVIIINERKR